MEIGEGRNWGQTLIIGRRRGDAGGNRGRLTGRGRVGIVADMWRGARDFGWRTGLALGAVVLAAMVGDARAQEGATAPSGASAPGDAPRRIVYAGDRAFPPYEYLDEQGRPAGFNIELLHAISAETGVVFDIRLEVWDIAVARFLRGQADMMTLAYSDERDRRIDWLGRVWTLQQAIAFREGRSAYPAGLDGLATETVAVEAGSLVEELLLALPEVRRPALVRVPNQRDCLRAVMAGAATAAGGNELTLRHQAAAEGFTRLEFRTVKSALYQFAVRKGERDRYDIVSTGLGLVRDHGTFDRLVERHLASRPEAPTFGDVARYLLGTLLVIALALGVFFVWNRSLRHEIVARREANDRLARLQSVTAALGEAVSADDVTSVIVEQGVASVGASAGLVGLLQEEGQQLDIVRAVGYPDTAVEPWRRIPMRAKVPLTEAVRRGQPVLLDDFAVVARDFPEAPSARSRDRFEPIAAIPLTLGARTLGVLGFSFSRKRAFTRDDERMMLAFARQCAQALDRARLYEIERTARLEAETASRGKDEFLATLSHELRTPVNAILGWSHMLRAGILDTAKTKRALEAIERNAMVQTRLIADLLDVSRAMLGHLRLDLQLVNVVTSVEAAIDAVRPSADEAGLVITGPATRTPALVSADSARMQQVFSNLLSNAIKFTPQGGTIAVEIRRGDSDVTVWITDSGVGIPPERLPFVFDRFYQVDTSLTRAHGGLGLGLAIVRHLVEQHGGTVSVESDGHDQGSRFTVTFPLAKTS